MTSFARKFASILLLCAFLGNIVTPIAADAGFGSFSDDTQKNFEDGVVMCAATAAILMVISFIAGAMNVPTNDVPTNIKESILDCLFWAFKNAIIQEMTGSTVQWIQTGMNGNPAFVQNVGGYLRDVADREAGSYIEKVAPFLCSPFRADIQLHLNLLYKNESGRGPAGVNGSSCTLSESVENIDNFLEGDFYSGGWDGWQAMFDHPQNNPYGSYFEARDELAIRISSATGEASTKISLGNGFLSKEVQDCYYSDTFNNRTPITIQSGETINQAAERQGVNTADIGGTFECDEPRIITPGSQIKTSLEQVFGVNLDQVATADEFNEIFMLAAAWLASDILTGDEGLSGYDPSKIDHTLPPPPPGGELPGDDDDDTTGDDDDDSTPDEEMALVEALHRYVRTGERATEPTVLKYLRPQRTEGWNSFGGSQNLSPLAFAAVGDYQFFKELADVENTQGIGSREFGSPNFYFSMPIAAKIVALRDARAAGDSAAAEAIARNLLQTWTIWSLVAIEGRRTSITANSGGSVTTASGDPSLHGLTVAVAGDRWTSTGTASSYKGDELSMILSWALDVPRSSGNNRNLRTAEGFGWDTIIGTALDTDQYGDSTSPEGWGLTADSREKLQKLVEGDTSVLPWALSIVSPGLFERYDVRMRRTTEGVETILFLGANGNKPAQAAMSITNEGVMKTMRPCTGNAGGANSGYRVAIADETVTATGQQGRCSTVSQPELGGSVIYDVYFNKGRVSDTRAETGGGNGNPFSPETNQ